jgi:hypothetical protein
VIGYGRGQLLRIPGNSMAALIAILVFIAAILVLNVVEFGRPD